MMSSIFGWDIVPFIFSILDWDMELSHGFLVHLDPKPGSIHGHRKGTILAKSPGVVDEDFVSQGIWVAVKFNHWLILHVGRVGGERRERKSCNSMKSCCQTNCRSPNVWHNVHPKC